MSHLFELFYVTFCHVLEERTETLGIFLNISLHSKILKKIILHEFVAVVCCLLLLKMCSQGSQIQEQCNLNLVSYLILSKYCITPGVVHGERG